jgi:hypothetical protein
LVNATTTVDLSHAVAGASARTDYVMTPGASIFVDRPDKVLSSDRVVLNGRPLVMGGGAAGGTLPEIVGAKATAVAAMDLPPLAVSFAVIHGSRAC